MSFQKKIGLHCKKVNHVKMKKRNFKIFIFFHIDHFLFIHENDLIPSPLVSLLGLVLLTGSLLSQSLIHGVHINHTESPFLVEM